MAPGTEVSPPRTSTGSALSATICRGEADVRARTPHDPGGQRHDPGGEPDQTQIRSSAIPTDKAAW